MKYIPYINYLKVFIKIYIQFKIRCLNLKLFDSKHLNFIARFRKTIPYEHLNNTIINQ